MKLQRLEATRIETDFEMKKQIQDDETELVNALRAADRPVSIDANNLTQKLVASRTRSRRVKRIRSAAILCALPVVLLALGMAMNFGNNSRRSPGELAKAPAQHGSPIHSKQAQASDVKQAVSQNDFHLSELQRDIDTLVQIESLKSRSRRLKEEIELLKQISLKNDWLLTRERVSRDGLAESFD